MGAALTSPISVDLIALLIILNFMFRENFIVLLQQPKKLYFSFTPRVDFPDRHSSIGRKWGEE
jgi:hypothetical protein